MLRGLVKNMNTALIKSLTCARIPEPESLNHHNIMGNEPCSVSCRAALFDKIFILLVFIVCFLIILVSHYLTVFFLWKSVVTFSY